MVKSKNTLIKIIVALIVIVGVLAMYACEKSPEPFLSVSDINGLRDLIEEKILYLEWLDTYDDTKPTLVVFHGETDKNEIFTINLDSQVYNSEVTFLSEKINVETIGLKGNGLKLNENGYYDMTQYWQETAGYNVAIFHAEKFFSESYTDGLTKIFTAYKSRYLNENTEINVNFNYSLAEVFSAIYIEECQNKVVNFGREIRFLGYGIGSNLALSCAYIVSEGVKNGVIDDYRPSRITLCDAMLSEESLDYNSVSFAENVTTDDGIGGITYQLAKKVSDFSALEYIENNEVVTQNNVVVKTRAYDNANDGSFYEKFKSLTAHLLLSQSYSSNSSFGGYKEKNRVSFDWYVYSVIGSDDSVEWESGSQKYAVGYPHKYNELSTASKSSINWGTNGRRPILNKRKLSNDARSDVGSTSGKNFGIGAWTPTAYILALKGKSFTQKDAGKLLDDTDVHGNNVYEYEDYVLPTFKSENYQYCDLGETILTGVINNDADGDTYVNDGIGIKSSIFITVSDSSGNVLVSRTKTTTDEYGRYFIYVKDTTDYSQKISFTATDNGGIINNFSAKNDNITVEIELYTPKGYTANVNKPSDITWYESVERNTFKNGSVSISVSKNTVNSAIINNCFVVASDK